MVSARSSPSTSDSTARQARVIIACFITSESYSAPDCSSGAAFLGRGSSRHRSSPPAPLLFRTRYLSPHRGGLPGYFGWFSGSSYPVGTPTQREAVMAERDSSSRSAFAALASTRACLHMARQTPHRRCSAPAVASSSCAGSSIASGDSRSSSIRRVMVPSVSYFWSSSSMLGTPSPSPPGLLPFLPPLLLPLPLPFFALPPPPPPPLARALRFGRTGGATSSQRSDAILFAESPAAVRVYIAPDSSCCHSSV
mmetsp:Transcript_453/g.1417  ORF Transcript_453/g.1417 Transcript_453/m.1417 type:complete len:253 (-) Transcript_453:369-1127(-)